MTSHAFAPVLMQVHCVPKQELFESGPRKYHAERVSGGRHFVGT